MTSRAKPSEEATPDPAGVLATARRGDPDLPAGPGGDVGAAGGPALTVSAVARRLGVEPATLRTWHRRYGLGPSAHHSGRHRRYTAEDLLRLEAMRRLVQSGVAPADAARQVLDTAGGGDAMAAAIHSLEGIDGRVSVPRLEWQRPSRTRPGGPGGRVIGVGANAAPVTRGLSRAAQNLDGHAIAYLVEEAIEARGASSTWEDVLCPVLASVGERWESSGSGVEVEHLLSDISGAALRRVSLAAPEPVHGRPILLACAPREEHNLPLAALAAVTAERLGVGSRLLGGGLPVTALSAAVARTGPSVVVVWSLVPTSADGSLFDVLPGQRPAPVLVAAGPGWRGQPLPERVVRAESLEDAVAAIRDALPASVVPGAGPSDGDPARIAAGPGG